MILQACSECAEGRVTAALCPWKGRNLGEGRREQCPQGPFPAGSALAGWQQGWGQRAWPLLRCCAAAADPARPFSIFSTSQVESQACAVLNQHLDFSLFPGCLLPPVVAPVGEDRNLTLLMCS